mmetsp:Transcript_1724/g.3053  ORF Transcript_1724/g.3053 Transcript_1724/m.3053 type:complete len:135 (+) Transcript_1724:1046-1450(+)
MTDFCYFANTTLIVFLLFFPKNDQFFKTAFFFANGALAVAVGTFRNQMVFHRYDNLTCLSLHILPQITTWNIRWTTMPFEADLPEEKRRFGTTDTTFSMKELFLIPFCFYLLWATLYFLINFVVAADRIRKRNY